MQPWLRRLISVFTLVSRIPVNYEEKPDYSRADLFLPIVGLAAGIVALVAYSLADLVFLGPIPPALAAILAQYLAFNLFHFDGLLDTADALGPLASKERRLEILKDPRSGSFAVFAGIAVILARIGALSEPGIVVAATILGAPVAGRAAACFVVLTAAPAKPDGLGAAMTGFRFGETALGYALAMAPAAIMAGTAGRPLAALVALAGGLAVAAVVGVVVAYRYVKSVGGYTGDALGAAVEIGEVAFMLAYAAVANFM